MRPFCWRLCHRTSAVVPGSRFRYAACNAERRNSNGGALMDINAIKPDLMVHARGQGSMKGAEGVHVGTVDHLDGDRFIKLKRKDSPDGQHHWIPLEWVEKVDDKAVYLSRSEDEFRQGL